MIFVIIIDQFYQRKNRLADLFLSIGCRVLTYSKNSIEEWDASLCDWIPLYEGKPELVNLMLIHGGDQYYKNCITAKKRIWYSGGIGRDIRAESGEESIFIALDDSGDNMLSIHDAEELLNYALGVAHSIPLCIQSGGGADSKFE